MYIVDNDRLKEVCKERGISQKTLAERTKIAPCLISYYMSGQRRPNVNNLFKIGEALQINVYDLIVRL